MQTCRQHVRRNQISPYLALYSTHKNMLNSISYNVFFFLYKPVLQAILSLERPKTRFCFFVTRYIAVANHVKVLKPVLGYTFINSLFVSFSTSFFRCVAPLTLTTLIGKRCHIMSRVSPVEHFHSCLLKLNAYLCCLNGKQNVL